MRRHYHHQCKIYIYIYIYNICDDTITTNVKYIYIHTIYIYNRHYHHHHPHHPCLAGVRARCRHCSPRGGGSRWWPWSAQPRIRVWFAAGVVRYRDSRWSDGDAKRRTLEMMCCSVCVLVCRYVVCVCVCVFLCACDSIIVNTIVYMNVSTKKYNKTNETD